eukprot:CAMPEP_0183333440 /NCGR_PEP_ID=MMETSP0164_2-20130417/2336_1 /TAXON_ID=221442 /ORGANISM="Coccolithus pelagicus ssp braarudi, Strain PLY182g" /LENGTH=71 /DNA_ID=CAMNT_0025502361 /DNA_START=520 /DNA_END=735 /DNA_ORIENTATION=+
MRLVKLRYPIQARSAVLMSFIREKILSHSEVSAGMMRAMTTRRSTRVYSSLQWTNVRAHIWWYLSPMSVGA